MDRAARETERGAKRIQSNLTQLQRGFATAGRALAGFGVGFSLAAVTHSLIDATAEAIEFGDEIAKAMAKTGLGAEAMTELAAVAKQSEVELSTLTTALRNMQVVISDAAVGNKAAAQALKDLGLICQGITGADARSAIRADRTAHLGICRRGGSGGAAAGHLQAGR